MTASWALSPGTVGTCACVFSRRGSDFWRAPGFSESEGGSGLGWHPLLHGPGTPKPELPPTLCS